MTACRSCAAPVLWATTVPGDRNVPLDVATVDVHARGALVVIPRHARLYAYTLGELAERVALKRAVSTRRAEEIISAEFDAHLSHFSSCPNADRHRRSR